MRYGLKQLAFLSGVALLLVIGIYIYFQAENLIEGPVILTIAPENGAEVTHSLIEVTGTAKNISYIQMNNRQIFVNEEGTFSEKLLLSLGYNIITIAAEDKFGRETKEVLEIVYKQ